MGVIVKRIFFLLFLAILFISIYPIVIQMDKMGIVILFIVFIFPGLLYCIVSIAHVKGWCHNVPSKIIDWLKTHTLIIILFFFFAANGFIAILSPIFVEHNKQNINLPINLHRLCSSLYSALDDAGYILLILLIPIVIITYLTDKFIKKAGQYSYFLGGYIDPITSDKNISLRITTFFNLLESVDKVKALGEKIGSNFAKRIVGLNSSLSEEANIKHFCEKWTEVDEKAGWCTKVEYDEDTNILTLHDSIAFLHKYQLDNNGKEANTNVSDFIEGYVYGALKVVDSNIQSITPLKPNKTKKTSTFLVIY